jgi:hypothetical protein
MDYTGIASILEQEAAKRTALVDAAAALRQIGSLQNAVAEQTAAHTEVSVAVQQQHGLLAAAKAELSRLQAGAKAEAAQAVIWVDQHIGGARVQAQEIVDLARAEAAKVWAELNKDMAAGKAALVAEIDKLLQDKARAETDANLAQAALANWEQKIVDAQARLDLIRQAASKLAA